jgi:uncharacterized protein YdeI (YjbR/CyaY-like superfamily)
MAFDTWLENNYQRVEGIWLKIAKKSSGMATLTDDEAVDVGLCWGWISGQRRALDDSYYLQKYVPRRHKSVWSQVNVEKVKSLTRAGRMREPGMAEVLAAQSDGRWDAAYVSQRNARVPEDLAKALSRNKAARRAFSSLGKTAKYAHLLRILRERRPERRAALIRKLITALADGDTA